MADSVFQILRKAILEGKLAPGERLLEQELSRELNVSRTPLREAIRSLESAGLVIREPNRTARVAPLYIEEMIELSTVREVLEGLAARELAARVARGAVSLEILEQTLLRMEALLQAGDAFGVLELGGLFHRQLHALSGHRKCAEYLEKVIAAFERYRFLVRDDPVRERTLITEHRAILERIAAADPQGAEEVMRAHIRTAREWYTSHLAGKLDQRPDSLR